MGRLIFWADWDIIWVVSCLTMGSNSSQDTIERVNKENEYFFPRLDEVVISWENQMQKL